MVKVPLRAIVPYSHTSSSEVLFLEAMHKAGIQTKDNIIGNGKLHRFHVIGDKPKSKNGWYTLFSDSVPAGIFGNWKTGHREAWCAKSYDELTPDQRVENKRRMVEVNKARELEMHIRQESAARKASSIWHACEAAPMDHPYLVSKGIKSHGLRVYKGALVIPILDEYGKAISSLQFIDAAGNKRFLSGGRKKECYFTLGNIIENFEYEKTYGMRMIPPLTNTICITEGYATGASIYEATEYDVFIAFDAGNLTPVAQSVSSMFPGANIIICADDDNQTPGNPGVTKAKEAAQIINGFLAIPRGCHE